MKLQPVKPETALPQFDYLTLDSERPVFFKYPRFLFEMTEVNLLAKNVYILLLNKTGLSTERGWIDNAGHVYVIYPEEKLACENHVTVRTVRTALSDLVKVGLIERKRIGFSAPNAIFLKMPLRKESSGMDTIEEENFRYDRKNSSGMTGRKLPVNKIYYTKNNNSKNMDATASPTPKRFTPPTHEEAKAYFAEKGSTDTEAENFMDYHDSNGWKVGKVPMKDWKAAARKWIRNKVEWAQKQKTPARPAEKEYKRLGV